MPPFGPPIPDGAMFPKSADFAEFLLTKGRIKIVHKLTYISAVVKRPQSDFVFQNFISELKQNTSGFSVSYERLLSILLYVILTIFHYSY